MRRTTIAAAALAMVLASMAGTAVAGMPYPQKMKCPVGGERFIHTGTMSHSTWGSRPDGKPYGSWTFPMPLPECPGNQLVMYREFSKDEVARLATLIKTDAYRAMVSGDSSYYRAAWLERELKPQSDSIPWLVLSASWQVDDQVGTKARYQREVVAVAQSMPPPAADVEDRVDWLVLQARAANALRELGEFDAALAQIRSIPTNELEVPIPERTDTNYEVVMAAETKRALIDFLKALETVIARRDRSSEPLDMTPPDIVATICLDAKDAADLLQPTGVCKQPAVVEAMAEMAQYRD